MNEAIYSVRTIEGFIYSLFYEQESVEGTFDFGNDALNTYYLSKFIDGTFQAYYATKRKLCKCCNQVTQEIDSIGMIHAKDVGDAMIQAFEYLTLALRASSPVCDICGYQTQESTDEQI